MSGTNLSQFLTLQNTTPTTQPTQLKKLGRRDLSPSIPEISIHTTTTGISDL